MVATLSDDIRTALKEPLMREAEAYVDTAVDNAVAALKPRIEAYVDNLELSTTIKILVERRDIDAKKA